MDAFETRSCLVERDPALPGNKNRPNSQESEEFWGGVRVTAETPTWTRETDPGAWKSENSELVILTVGMVSIAKVL